jgi:hypothetical protein
LKWSPLSENTPERIKKNMNIPHFESLTPEENDLFADWFQERVAIMVIDGKVPEAEAIQKAKTRIMGQILKLRREKK